MLKWIKSLFGKDNDLHWSRPDIYDSKRGAIAEHIGPAHDSVIAAVIGWDMGGPVDLWVYPEHVPGSVLVTMQLAVPGCTDQRRGSMGYYELAMATRHSPAAMFKGGADDSDPDFDEDGELASERELTPYGEASSEIRMFLTNLAHYTSMAVLDPGQTAEFPTEEMGSVFFVFDALVDRDAGLRVLGKPYGVLLAIRVYESELAYAQEHGTDGLIELLRDRGVYPYSDLDREPVV